MWLLFSLLVQMIKVNCGCPSCLSFWALRQETRSLWKARKKEQCCILTEKEKEQREGACLAFWSPESLMLLPQSSTAQEKLWPQEQLLLVPRFPAPSHSLVARWPPGAHTLIPTAEQALPASDATRIYIPNPPIRKQSSPVAFSPGLALICLSLKSIWGTKELASRSTVRNGLASLLPRVLFWRKCKLTRVQKWGIPMTEFQKERVVRAFLGKGEGVGKEGILFPWNRTKQTTVYASHSTPDLQSVRREKRVGAISPAKALVVSPASKQGKERDGSLQFGDASFLRDPSAAEVACQCSHIFPRPSLATEVLSWWSALNKQWRWEKELELSHFLQK